MMEDNDFGGLARDLERARHRKEAAANPPNPKQRYGDLKVPLGLVPSSSIIFEALALKQGAEKYGPYNWRETGVEAMTYVHAAERHLRAWLDGEEMDSESGLPHLGHAKACLGILIDADECGKLIDNRPLPAPTGDLLFVWAEDDIMAEDTPTTSELIQRRNEARWGDGMYGPVEGYVDDDTAYRRRWIPEPKLGEAGPTPEQAAAEWYPFTSHRTMAEIMDTEERAEVTKEEPSEHYGVPAHLQAWRKMNQRDAFGEGDESDAGNPVPMPTGDCQLDGRNCPPDHDHAPKWEAMTPTRCVNFGEGHPIFTDKRPCDCERGRCKLENGHAIGVQRFCCQAEEG